MSTTDEQIRAAYERLDEALAPPMDGVARVSRRISARRRGRRAGLAGAVAVVVLAATGTVVTLASGDHGDGDTVAVDQPPGTSTLVLTRPDGSTYAFDDVTVSCRPPEEYANPEGPAPSRGRIWMFSPMEMTGPVDAHGASGIAHAVQPFVTFEGIVAKIQGDQTFTLPSERTDGSSDDRPMTLFVDDPSHTAKRDNEVSSAESGAAGTVRVLEASCNPTPVLRLEVDATLGSEVEQGTLDLAGALG